MANFAETGACASPQTQPRLLGSLLVEHGLLTAAQLHEALAEQQRSGVPLGQVVVQRGYASPGAVARALATQHGGVAKTEFGMAVGFETDLGRVVSRPPPASVEAEAGVAASAPPEEPESLSYSELQRLVRAGEERLDVLADQMVEAARRLVATEIDRDRARELAAASQQQVTHLQREVDRLAALLAAGERRCA